MHESALEARLRALEALFNQILQRLKAVEQENARLAESKNQLFAK